LLHLVSLIWECCAHNLEHYRSVTSLESQLLVKTTDNLVIIFSGNLIGPRGW
jgi:hypothetical protein